MDRRSGAGRLDPPAFVDLRVVRLVPRTGVEIGLLHALLNCSIGLFIIESLGFGRGLGALKLSKKRIEKYMQMLSPNTLSDRQRVEIVQCFLPLLKRDLLNIADELEQSDRQEFDAKIIESLKLDVNLDRIYESLRVLVEIRATARL